MLRRLHQLTALPALALTAATLAAVSPTADTAHDRDCVDFDTQRQAQRFLDRNHPARDPHRVDPHRVDDDADGIACEALPCPCDRDGPGPPGTEGASALRRDRAEFRYANEDDTGRSRSTARSGTSG